MNNFLIHIFSPSALRRIVIGCTLFALFLGPRPVEAQEEGQLRTEPIRLESRSEVLVREDEKAKVFVSTGQAEVRQGGMRIVAPRMVLWLDKDLSRSAAQVRVYAQGLGSPGDVPTQPVHLVNGDAALRKGVVYRHLSSQLGLVWDCPVKEVDSEGELGSVHRVARSTTQGRGDFVQEELPGRPSAMALPSIRQVLEADEIHFFTDEATGITTGVYLGDVRGTYRNVKFSSDVAVLWIKQKTESYEFYARGDVRIQRKEGEEDPENVDMLGMGEFENFRADEIYINPDRERARASRAEVRMQQTGTDEMVMVRGKEVFVLDTNNLVIEEGSATHCPFGDPHYQLAAERARLVQDDPHLFISAWDMELETGANEAALFRLPFLSADLGERPGYVLRSVKAGNSSQFGTFVRTRWRPRHLGLDADWMTGWDVRLDYFGARGPGLGTELEYGFDEDEDVEDVEHYKHAGFLRAYYVHDSGDEDHSRPLEDDDTEEDEDDDEDEDEESSEPVPQENRGRFWLGHRSELSERWRLDTELYWLSDVGFLGEYFEEEFENDRPPESYVFTRYRGDQVWAGLTLKKQINDFMTQLEETPGLDFQVVGLPLGPLVYDAGFEVGHYDLEISDELMEGDPPDLWRGHTEHRLSLPFSLGAVRLDPFFEILGTWASEGARPGGGHSGSESRLGAGGGVRTSIDFMRTYAADNPALGINRLRHVLTPYAEVHARGVNTGSEEFIQLGGHDPWPRFGHGERVPTDRVDAIDDLTEVRVGLQHRLQTKRRNGSDGPWYSIDWMDLDVAFVGRSDDSVRTLEDDNYIDIDFVWNLLSWLKLYSEDNRISTGDGTDVINLGAAVQLSPQTGFGFSYHYISDSSSNFRGNFRLRLSDRYTLSLYEQYELDSEGEGESANLETYLALERLFHKWLGRLVVYYDSGNDGDTGVMIEFSPAGLPGFKPLGFGSFEE